MQEIRLNDAHGKTAGNIDFILVAYDEAGQITDFGSLEVQAVYISGNVRLPFVQYMADRDTNKDMVWTATNVRADYLSSSRKRLVPQMLYKGSIKYQLAIKEIAMKNTHHAKMTELLIGRDSGWDK